MTTPSSTSAPRAPRTGGSQQGDHLSVETLTREARKVLAARGEEMSPSRLSKVIRRYIRVGRGDVDFRSWFIAYADPVGEQATRNVMRQRGY
jgi:hypothetical protein